MTFRCLIDEIRKAVISSIEKLDYHHYYYDNDYNYYKESEEFDISEPARKEYGDLSCNVAFQLSKKLKKRPFEIANEIVVKQLTPYISENQNKDNQNPSFILSAEAHQSG